MYITITMYNLQISCDCSCNSNIFRDIYYNTQSPKNAVLSGKVRVKGFAFTSLLQFASSFDFSTQKWKDYYTQRDLANNYKKSQPKQDLIDDPFVNFFTNPSTNLQWGPSVSQSKSLNETIAKSSLQDRDIVDTIDTISSPIIDNSYIINSSIQEHVVDSPKIETANIRSPYINETKYKNIKSNILYSILSSYNKNEVLKQYKENYNRVSQLSNAVQWFHSSYSLKYQQPFLNTSSLSKQTNIFDDDTIEEINNTVVHTSQPQVLTDKIDISSKYLKSLPFMLLNQQIPIKKCEKKMTIKDTIDDKVYDILKGISNQNVYSMTDMLYNNSKNIEPSISILPQRLRNNVRESIRYRNDSNDIKMIDKLQNKVRIYIKNKLDEPVIVSPRDLMNPFNEDQTWQHLRNTNKDG